MKNAVFALGVAVASKEFRPTEVPFSSLANTDDFIGSGFEEEVSGALSGVGMVAVSGIPKYARARKEVLQAAYLCSEASDATMETKFNEGTMRRSLASSTVAGKARPINLGSTKKDECNDFEKKERSFRQMIQDVTTVFAQRLGDIYGNFATKPLLSTEGEKVYHNVHDVVGAGDHLEHFHAYHPSADNTTTTPTIDLHTDQGLFIAFTPAIMVDKVSGKPTGTPPGDFQVQLNDGSIVSADLNDDTLVFMMGDAVNQVINTKLPDNQRPLRPTPHALSMALPAKEEVRLWHGRMVLPPSDGMHEEHRVTFGKLRDLVVKDTATDSPLDPESSSLSLGCSRNLMVRQLSGDDDDDEKYACADNQLYCWMRCMNETKTVSNATCTAAKKEMKCVDMYEQVYRPGIDTHGDYTLECTTSTKKVTASPTMAPPAKADCDKAKDSLSKAGDDGFTHHKKINDKTHLYVKDAGNDGVTLRLTHLGNLGWMALGVPNPDGKAEGLPHPSMNGANIVMGVHDETDSPNPTVGKYKISDYKSGFRWWKSSRSTSGLKDATIKDEDCHAVLEFTIKDFGGVKLDPKKTNKIMWGLHETTKRVGYHGFMNKGVIDVDFTEVNLSPTFSDSQAVTVPVLHSLGFSVFVLLFV